MPLISASPKAYPEVSYCNPTDPLMRRALVRLVEYMTGQPKLQRIYDAYKASSGAEEDFWASAVEWLKLSVLFDESKLDNLPKEGPLVIIANHPYGVLDGIAVSYLVSRVRPDFKLLAHAVLGRAEPLRPFLIPIEFEGASSAVRTNVHAKRAALDHLANGNSLLIFPAGRVSTSAKTFGQATDAPWKMFAGKLIAQSGATVVPIFCEGQNGWLFHFVSKFSESLREALLMREVATRIGSEVRTHIGAPIPSELLEGFRDRQLLLDHLRRTVYGLSPNAPKLIGSPAQS